ncbi:hypothetical protein M6D81_20130 [Paenibacillus sp. J5C_2022]|uniref:hypothetical protein n=1 Tax=Paenibacillus sp. J5C2022 TaxID=2977129 RepID=UPI0021D2386B|nr:hypothetical protein [Paenibacillus sp. J5C2022]MCU6711009.1 hypothetical protein [Paenibacillus sp. J5C2022]
MLRKKIGVCAALFLLIIVVGALLNHEVYRLNYHFLMTPPVPEDKFRIYSSFDPELSDREYMQYMPREYVKIIDTERP